MVYFMKFYSEQINFPFNSSIISNLYSLANWQMFP